MNKKPKVLFLSSGNSTRSQMGEGFLRSMAGQRFEVASAGIESNAGVNPLAVEAMAEVGIDVSQIQEALTNVYRHSEASKPGFTWQRAAEA